MNGRVYSPDMGRFLSVDPFIQSPANSQSLNPYSYIMNNPMAGTDPTGYTAECNSDGSVCDVGNISTDDVESIDVTKDGNVVVNTNDGNSYQVDSINGANAQGNFGVNGSGQLTDLGGLTSIASNGQDNDSGSPNSNTQSVGTPKPEDSDGWEYIGQRGGIDTYQTVHTPESEGIGIGGVNDNIVTPTGLAAGYIQNKTETTKKRWSDRYRNHGKYWDRARLIGNYAFVAGAVITAGTTVNDIVNMRNEGGSLEDQVLRGADGVADIAFATAAFFGPVGWGVAALYYGADYLSGGNLTEFIPVIIQDAIFSNKGLQFSVMRSS